jgi:hypothetical protein
MRRIAIATVVATSLLVVAPLTAGASSPQQLDRDLAGPFVGRQDWAFGQGCTFVHQLFTLELGTRRNRDQRIATDGCVAPDMTGHFAYSGTFTLTTGKRVTASGTVTGTSIGGTDGLHLRLTITSGAAELTHITGTIAVDGEWLSGPAGNEGPASGTATTDLRRV